MKKELNLPAWFALLVLLLGTSTLSAQLTVTVFRDFNANGTQDFGADATSSLDDEVFVTGLTVTAYDAAGSAFVFTDNGDGTYSFAGGGGPYRVEVTGFTTTGINSAQPGAAGNTTVLFMSDGGSESVGLNDGGDYCEPVDDIWMLLPCHAVGNLTVNGGSNGNVSGLVSVQFVVTNNADDQPEVGETAVAASIDQVGNTWGVAYDRVREIAFTSALARRHAAFGPQGPNAIYMVDYSDPSAPILGGYLDLGALITAEGGTASVDPRILLPGTLNDQLDRATASGSNTSNPNEDKRMFDPVGQLSFGDIEVSDDGRTMWVTNLADMSIYQIDLTMLTLGTAGTDQTASLGAVTRINAGLDGPCGTGHYSIWATEYYRGQLYVGHTCTGLNSQDRNDLSARVMRLDGGTFVPVAGTEVQLENIQRGGTINMDCDARPEACQWNAWADDFDDLLTGTFDDPANNNEAAGRIGYPQPILSDIEFDVDGSIVLGFLDRTAFQHRGGSPSPGSGYSFDGLDNSGGSGNNDLDGGSSDPNRINGLDGGGDLYRLCSDGAGGYVQDGSGGCANFTVPFNRDSEYYADRSRQGGGNHMESIMGSSELIPGTSLIVTPGYDVFDGSDNGILWLNNTDGSLERSTQLFLNNSGGFGTFGKGGGLGDLESDCGAAPIEIGNYVWNDSNNPNGIQDPGEAPLVGVVLELWADTNGDGTADTKVAETTTNADGNYLFSVVGANVYGTEDWSFTAADAVQPFTAYEVRVPNMIDISGTMTPLTTTDGSGQSDNDNILDIRDSDPTAAGVITFTTGEPGANNHGLDVGYALNNCVTINSVAVSPSPLCSDEQSTITITHEADLGNLALYYSTTGGLTAADIYAGTGTGQMTINTAITPAAAATTTDELFSFPANTSGAPITYHVYAALAPGNPNIVDPDCQPLATISIVVNPETPVPVVTATGTVCDDPADGTNTIDLNTLVTSPLPATGTWTLTGGGPLPAGSTFSGSVFTAAVNDIGSSYTFTYTISGTSGTAACGNQTVSTTITVLDCSIPPCILTLGTPDPGNCVYDMADNRSEATVSVEVNWTNPPAGEMISVELQGGSVLSINPVMIDPSAFPGGSTTVMFEVFADGSGPHDIVAQFATTTTCTDTEPVTFETGCCPVQEFTICTDGSTTATLTADPGLTDVIWFNGSDVEVGTGPTLTVDATMTPFAADLADGMEDYYYTATDNAGCTGQLCCPITILTEVCFTCPIITDLTTQATVCNGSSPSSLAVDVSGLDTYTGDLTFVLFDAPQTGTGMYDNTPLANLGTVANADLTGGTVDLSPVMNFPTEPGIYYVYAILADAPVSPNDDCRPFAEATVEVLKVDCGTFPWLGGN